MVKTKKLSFNIYFLPKPFYIIADQKYENHLEI